MATSSRLTVRRSAGPARAMRQVAIVGLLCLVGGARAGIPTFGAQDIQTVFFIDKTDDKNRVDYGLRLDAACAPVGKAPLFPYWREFEKAPPVRIHDLGWWEYVIYGVSDQRVVGRSEQGVLLRIQLRRLARPIEITVSKDPDGHCQTQAKTVIAGVADAELISVHATLSKIVKKVLYIDVLGRRSNGGEPISERMHP